MADPEVNQEPTQEPAVQAQEPTQEPVQAEPSTPAAPDPNEALVEKAFQKASSWWGRREKELRDEFQGQLGQVLEVIKQGVPQAQEPQDPTTRLLNDPEGFISSFFTKQQQAEMQRGQTWAKAAASIMDADPDFQDQALGEAVVEKIKGMQMNPNLAPEVAADLMVSKAKALVLGEKVRTKTNPLSKNTPATAPLGTVTPGASPSPAKPTAKVADDVRAYGRKLGLTDEEIDAEFLKG